MKHNILFDTDSYKVSHNLQYPENTSSMFSYIESRGGDYPETLFFGLQYYLKEYLSKSITVEDVEKAKILFEAHGEPFNYEGWMYIAKDLKGKLPVRIRAPQEGSIIPTSNILVSVESTDPKVFWVASWLETSLLRSIWYPTTVATRSYHIKKIILEGLNKSSDDPNAEIVFKLHDFGSRGVSSQESAMLGGMAHLVNFMGTDTAVALLGASEYYNCPMAGFSIPASEHSSITSWGKENEVEAYRNMLNQFGKPGKIFACVSDSYDLFNACSNLWGTALKDEIIKSGATVVIRPDSGHPPTVVLKTIQLLDEKFGHTINSKGFKVLNNVRVIQGDGINEHSIQEIIDVLLENNYSISNIAFGMGGQLLQGLNRDTLRFAMKCSSITVNGKERDVFKDPVTDHGKRSKPGRLDLSFEYTTVPLFDDEIFHKNTVMKTVYENGELKYTSSFDQIREKAKFDYNLQVIRNK
jgi:nicotinamide phosphoribosyltransferase